MADDPTITPEIYRNLEHLAKRGKHVNHVQRRILVHCYERPHSVRELAKLEGQTVQHIGRQVKILVAMNLLDKAFAIGNAPYFKCRFDLSLTADYSYRFTIRKEQLSFEQLLFYYYAEETQSFSGAITAALVYLYQRSKWRSEGKDLAGPTGAEVKSFVLSMCDQLQEFTTNIRILTEGKLFEQTPDCHELYGPVEGELFTDMMNRLASTIPGWWSNKLVGTKGIKLETPKQVAKNGRKKYDTRWELRIESKENT